MPGDGHLDPHTATYALAAAARELGVEIRTQTRVTGIELGADRRGARRRSPTPAAIESRRRRRTRPASGRRRCRRWSACSPVDPGRPPAHRAEGGARATSCRATCRASATPTTSSTASPSRAACCSAATRPNPPSRWVDGVPWEHGARSLPPDEERFAALMAGAVRRFPFLDDAGVVGLVCHPDAMTPDANPLLGPMPGVPGFWLAAGLSLNGFGGAGGIGKALAELDHGRRDRGRRAALPRRGASAARTAIPRSPPRRRARPTATTTGCAIRSTSTRPGRPQRLSARCTAGCRSTARCSARRTAGSAPTASEPGQPWRRAGADQRAFGWARPPYLERVAVEHAAFRERVGHHRHDARSASSRSPAPDALALLERVCGNRIDRPVGAVVYTQLLDERGGIVGRRHRDAPRRADRFRVVTGAGAVDVRSRLARAESRADDVERSATLPTSSR